jgi:hypothetical protein
MKFRKKEISLERNDEIMKRMMVMRTPSGKPESVSLRKFIDLNFQAFTDTGRTTREIYEFLKEENIDVGTFQVFKTLYSRVRRGRRTANPVKIPEMTEAPNRSKEQASPEAEKKEGPENRKAGVSQYNPALPPVYLSGGVEAIIDPETGAKCFEIKSGRESERK